MKKLLMHKDTIVAAFTLSDNNRVGSVQVKNQELFPAVGDSDVNAIRRWLISRKTSANRQDLATIIGFYGSQNFTSESLRSLSDCYWVQNADANLTWDEISAFQIPNLDADGVFLSVVKPKDFEEFEKNSPNLTLSGKTPLFWYYKDKTLGLINADSQYDMQNYKFAQANQIDIFKEREYILISGYIYTFVKTNTSEQVEKIPLDQLFLSVEDKSLSKSENFKRCCETYQIPDWKPFIQKLIAFNKLNPQRKIELLDIGVLRNADTLEYIGFDKL